MFIRLINNSVYISLNLHKSHITSTENYLFWVLYVRFNEFQIISLAWNKNDIVCVCGLLEKYPTFGREKESGLLGALDT